MAFASLRLFRRVYKLLAALDVNMLDRCAGEGQLLQVDFANGEVFVRAKVKQFVGQIAYRYPFGEVILEPTGVGCTFRR